MGNLSMYSSWMPLTLSFSLLVITFLTGTSAVGTMQPGPASHTVAPTTSTVTPVKLPFCSALRKPGRPCKACQTVKCGYVAQAFNTYPRNCTTKKDTTCDQCGEGSYWDPGFDECEICDDCPANEVMVEACTLFNPVPRCVALPTAPPQLPTVPPTRTSRPSRTYSTDSTDSTASTTASTTATATATETNSQPPVALARTNTPGSGVSTGAGASQPFNRSTTWTAPMSTGVPARPASEDKTSNASDAISTPEAVMYAVIGAVVVAVLITALVVWKRRRARCCNGAGTPQANGGTPPADTVLWQETSF